jgi:dUTP pyrophosphatase
MVVPRSSVGFHYNIRLWNTTGIIDADYYNNPANEGVINLKITNYGDKDYVVKKNDRIVQGIFVKYDTTIDDDADSERVGGLGSTGK